MPKISSYPDGGFIQAGDQFIIARAGANKSILGSKLSNRTSWTPVLAGTTTAGVGTYTTQVGDYFRLGSVLFFTMVTVWTAHTGTGNLVVTGLPYPNAGVGSTPVTVNWDNITLLAAGSKLTARIIAASSIITLEEIGSGAATSLPMDVAGILRIAGFYFCV